MSLEVRALRADEAPLVQPLAARAFDDLMVRQGREPRAPSPESAAAYTAVNRHVLGTDPGGSLLALRDGEPVGVAMSYRRGPLWVLSLLVVVPGRQSAGAGSALLEAVLADAPPLRLLHASPDPRAMRLYARAGFRLLPALEAGGTPVVTGAPELVPVEPAGPLAADLANVLALGGAVLGLPGGGRGVAVLKGAPGRWNVVVLDAPDRATAAGLLRGMLAVVDRPVEVGPLAPQEDWAVQVALEAGLALAPTGPVGVAGLADPLGGVAPPAAVYV